MALEIIPSLFFLDPTRPVDRLASFECAIPRLVAAWASTLRAPTPLAWNRAGVAVARRSPEASLGGPGFPLGIGYLWVFGDGFVVIDVGLRGARADGFDGVVPSVGFVQVGQRAPVAVGAVLRRVGRQRDPFRLAASTSRIRWPADPNIRWCSRASSSLGCRCPTGAPEACRGRRRLRRRCRHRRPAGRWPSWRQRRHQRSVLPQTRGRRPSSLSPQQQPSTECTRSQCQCLGRVRHLDVVPAEG